MAKSKDIKLAERPFKVGDRVVDGHGKEGLILEMQGPYFLVGFIVARQVTRSEISYRPSDDDIKEITAELRSHWSPDTEEKKSQYPNGAAEIPDLSKAKRDGRIIKRNVSS